VRLAAGRVDEGVGTGHALAAHVEGELDELPRLEGPERRQHLQAEEPVGPVLLADNPAF